VKVTCTDLVALILIRHFLVKLLVGLDGPVVSVMQLLDHHGGGQGVGARRRGIHWSSRLGVGREADDLTS
jgi:hypothetical protein